MRDLFLKTKWRPYPQPSRSLYTHPDWIWGRVEKIIGNTLQIAGFSEARPIASTENTHGELGPCVPSSILAPGDLVAYHISQRLCYLLSPYLAERPCESVASPSWNDFLETVRTFFIEKGFKHIWTPHLLPSGGVDAHIDFFTASGVRSQRQFYLPTSPELSLKKVMARGEQKIFEIKSCFRDDEPSPTHKSEFTMIEWYRAYADKWELLEDFESLLRFLQKELGLRPSENFVVRTRSLPVLFEELTNIPLRPNSSKEILKSFLEKHHKNWTHSDDWDDLFFRIYIEYVEPFLQGSDIEVLYNFPWTQGSLSRQTMEGWADRFEIYWNGIELANAYQEQNDPEAIEKRYYDEVNKRKILGRQPHPIDEDFLLCMKSGFPPSAGIALGLDRLWMVLNQKQTV